MSEVEHSMETINKEARLAGRKLTKRTGLNATGKRRNQ
jgi:hypothetical protein